MIISVDFETGSENGHGGLEWWKPDFQVKSAAFAWRDDQGKLKSLFVDDQEEMRERIADLKNHEVLVYNASFDVSIVRKWFPEAWPLTYVDVMRLRQQRELVDKSVGYGLKNAVKSHIRHLAGYEEPIKAWIRENVPEARKGKEGQHYCKAPREMLASYNVKDAEAALILFEMFCRYFERIEFDWTPDHEIYCEQVNQLYGATVHGIQIDKDRLRKFIEDSTEEVAKIDERFNTELAPYIAEAREILRQKEQSKFKKKVVTELPPFNITSKPQLKLLFVDIMGIEPLMTTAKGAPSFRSEHIAQFGEGGKILARRGKRLLLRAQAKGLLKKAEEESDGRYHPILKIVGTKSGRLAGDGGVNIQGVSRKEKGIMGAMVADDGYVFVEQDLVSGEPTLITHYSQDPFYRYTNIDGRGKRPFVKDGLLYIDDPYIAFGWVCDLYSEELKKAWNEGFDGVSFADQWLTDAEVVKAKLKKWRSLWKMLVLALGYSMQSKKLQFQVKVQFGITLTDEKAKEVFDAYWKMFALVKKASDGKKTEFKRSGGMIPTPFGFLAWPKAGHAAFNQYIQAQISSIVTIIAREVMLRCSYARYVTVIHDAVIWMIPLDKVDAFKVILDTVNGWLNNYLQWTVDISTGFAVGKTWADLK